MTSIPLQKQNWLVSNTDTREIARKLGIWWERLAKKFKFLDEEIEEIKLQYRDDLEMQKYQFMLRWNSKLGQKAKYGALMKALCELEQIDCLDEVCKLIKGQSEPGPPPPTALDRYRDQLKLGYLGYELQQIVKWPPPPSEKFIKLAMIKEHKIKRGEMDKEFVDMMMQGNVEDVLKKKIEIKPDEIFDIEPAQGKVILLEGAPGSGKTTVCWNVCKQWGNEKLFQQFSHVLMVELRDENTQLAKSLAEMLPYCEGNEVHIAEALKKKSGEGVLIILEGWDELPKEQQTRSIFKDLIKKSPRSLLQKAVILISSRSSVTANLQSLVKMRIEVLGFTPEQIDDYIQNCFESEPHTSEELIAKIRQSPKLRGSCYLPLNLTLIMHMYKCDLQLPETFCSIIIQLTLTCLYCYRRNTLHLEDDFNSFTELPDDIQPQFHNLCKLAFEATMDEKYSFSNLKTENLGLLQTVESIAARGNAKTQYFLHSSLQELCAAVHISIQPLPEQERMLELLFDNPKDFVLRFYSAITHWENSSLCKVLCRYSKELIKKTTEYLFVFPKPEVMSQTLMPFSKKMYSLHSNIILLLENTLCTVYGEKEFDVEKLTSNVNSFMGGSQQTEHDSRELATAIQGVMMKLADSSFDPDKSSEFQTETVETLQDAMMKIVDQHSSDQNIDGTNLKDLMKRMHNEVIGMGMSFDELETFVEELIQNFGTTDIPKDVLCTQITQMVQQKLLRKQPQIEEDPRVQMGIPIPPQEQFGQSAQLLIRDSYQKYAQDGKFPDLIQVMFHQDSLRPQTKASPDYQAHKAMMQLLNKHLQNTTSLQHVCSSIVHGAGTHNVLMLIHCIYESKNPALAQILQPALVLAGELNASDIIALQCIVEEGMCAHDLETLYIFTTIPSTEAHMLAKAIEKNTTFKTLALDIGVYDEMLVRTVFLKPNIKYFRHDWIMQNDMDRVFSCRSFFSCLRDNHNLKVLNLSNAKIGNCGAEELAKVVNSTRLTEVDLTGCGIEDEGVKALSDALTSNVFLNTLRLDDTHISRAALQSLSCALRQNNSLKVLGMVEDPFMTKIDEKDLEEFIVELKFNSSVVCVVLNGIRIHAPSLQEAVRLVNYTRRAKQQPRLAINDHYTLNYTPEIHNNTCCILRALQSMITTNNGNILIENIISVQFWHQTLISSLQFIDQSKAIRNMCLSQIIRPNSRTISINTHVKKLISYSVEVDPFRVLIPYIQYIDGSLCITQEKALKPTTGSYCIESIDTYQNTTTIEERMRNIVGHMMLPLCICIYRGELCSRCTFIIMKYTSRVPLCREDCYECTMQSLGLLLSVISNRFNVCQAVQDRVYTCVYSEQSHLCVSIPPLYIVNDVITKDVCKHSSMFSVLFEFLFSTSSFLHMFIPSCKL